MITLYFEVPFATCRKSFARSFAETYVVPPPATVYGMLLSLVGERFRKHHEGVRLALAYARLPKIATTLRKLSRFKYGVASKQARLGNAPDYIETLCDIRALCCVDSAKELARGNGARPGDGSTLEERIMQAIREPGEVSRYGVVCLGLSDDAIDDIRLCDKVEGPWQRVLPRDHGDVELPIWVDHVGAISTRWRRYSIDPAPQEISGWPEADDFTPIVSDLYDPPRGPRE